MSFFNDAQIKGMFTNEYPCPQCKALMEFEDEWEETLICPSCGYEVSSDHYGFNSDEEYDALYPTKEEVCGYNEDDEEDEYHGETYDEECGELSDD